MKHPVAIHALLAAAAFGLAGAGERQAALTGKLERLADPLEWPRVRTVLLASQLPG